MGDRCRILYLTPSGALNGGAQVQYRYLIEGLNGSRYEPVVIAPAAGDFNDALAGAGVPTWISPYPLWRRSEILRWRHRTWIERRRAGRRLIAFAHRARPHLVHGDVAVAPYLTAISAAFDIPAVVHVRGPLTRREARRLEVGRAARLIAIADGYREDLCEWQVAADRITVIPDATDLSLFCPRDDNVLRRADRSIREEDVLFGIVGRIEPFKRQLDFLRAAERVLAAGRRARFFVIGAANPNRPWYVRRVRTFPAAQGIDHAVTMMGHRHDMSQVMASLDVLVTLSGGSVMLEAMACGVPVITASSRNPDSLCIVRNGDAGRVVPSHDPQALTRAMVELCDDAAGRRGFGAKGRQRAETFFGRDRLLEDTVRLYDALIASRSTPMS
jgi:glycosyltransferase involved in cell wall biosynthesis